MIVMVFSNAFKWKTLLLFVLISFAIYFPVINGDFLINWDDDQQILNNSDVHQLSWASIKAYFTTYYVASYQPIATLSYAIEYYFFGPKPWVYHISNLLLFSLNGLLLFQLLSFFFRDKWLLFFLSIVYLIHPIQVEMAGWISTRSTLLCTLFYLLVCINYLKYIDAQKQHYLMISFLSFLGCVFSKSAGITLPIVLIGIDYCVKRSWRIKLALEKIPFIILSIIIALVSIDSRGVVETASGYATYYNLLERVSIISKGFVFYVEKLFIPIDFDYFYGYPYKHITESIPQHFLRAPYFALGILCFWAILLYCIPKDVKRKYLLGSALFLINLIPILNFTAIGEYYANERYAYIPFIGFLLVLGTLYSWLSTKVNWNKGVRITLLAAVAIFFSFSSNSRSKMWKDSETLFKTNAEKEGSHYPFSQLGKIELKKSNIQQSIEYFNKSIKLNPFNIDVYYWRGRAIKESGDYNYALIDFNRAIQASSKYSEACYLQIASIHFERGEIQMSQNYLDSSFVFSIDKKPLSKQYEEDLLADHIRLVKAISTNNESKIVQWYFEKLSNRYFFDNRINNLKLELGINTEGLNDKNLSQEQYEVLEKNVMQIFNKGIAAYANQNWEEAISHFKNALSLPSGIKGKIKLSLASALHKNGDYQKAIDSFSNVIQNSEARTDSNTIGEVYYYRALSKLKLGLNDSACKDLELAIELGFEDAKKIKHC